MAFLPSFENDIFISYSHVDNDPLIAGKLGWVDFFEDLLRKRVRVRLRGEVAIFRDPRLSHFGTFSEQLARKVSSSAVFLCILSPNYLGSDWCIRELDEFCRPGRHDRVIKVVKTAVDELSLQSPVAELLLGIREVLDFKFYRMEESSGIVRDLQPEVIADHIPAGLELIDSIAQHLVELLKKLRDPAGEKPIDKLSGAPAEVASAPQHTIYLAETTLDVATERQQVKTELQQFNCRVLPDQPLPQDSESLASAVSHYLEQADLSVHLVGANYGTRPELEERSIPQIQFDLAYEKSRASGLVQLVWMPDGLTPKDSSQQRFVDNIRNNSAEFLRTNLEDLKTEVRKKLRPAPASEWGDAADQDREDAPINVCLFCHEQDKKLVGPLYSHMMVSGMFRVKLPLEGLGSIQRHKELLQAADAVLLYYGTADEDWFVNIWRLIQRHISAGRSKPVLAKAIYAGRPATTEKELLESEDLVIIKNYGDFTAKSLTPFIERIRVAKEGKR